MKTDLAIYVLPCGKDKIDPDRAARSFEDPQYEVKTTVLRNADLWKLNGTHYDSRWFGYIYSNEWLDEDLAKAMPVFLSQKYFDVLSLCKKVLDNGKHRYFTMPRIFRNWIQLESGGLMPQTCGLLRIERALDGWVMEDDR